MNKEYNEFLTEVVDQIEKAIWEVGGIGMSDDVDFTPEDEKNFVGRAEEILRELRELQCRVLERIDQNK